MGIESLRIAHGQVRPAQGALHGALQVQVGEPAHAAQLLKFRDHSHDLHTPLQNWLMPQPWQWMRPVRRDLAAQGLLPLAAKERLGHARVDVVPGQGRVQGEALLRELRAGEAAVGKGAHPGLEVKGLGPAVELAAPRVRRAQDRAEPPVPAGKGRLQEGEVRLVPVEVH